MSEVVKVVDFKETMNRFGVSASIEGELPKLSHTQSRHPLLQSLDEAYAAELLKNPTIEYPLSAKGVAITAQFPIGSRIGLKFPGGMEAQAVVANGTVAPKNILEIGTLSKRDPKSGKFWVPRVHQRDEETFLYGLATMPSGDEHPVPGQAPAVGRHYAGSLLSIYGNTEVAEYLNAEGQRSLVNGPDSLEDLTKPENMGRRTLLSRGSAGPEAERAAIPVGNDFFPLVNPRLVDTYPPYAWIKDVKVVISQDSVDYDALKAYRIEPVLVKKNPDINLGDVIISTAAIEYGAQETIGKLERVVEQTMRLQKSR